MSRSKLREKIFRLLFRVEFHSDEEFALQEANFLKDEEQQQMTEEESRQVTEKCESVIEKLDEIDGMLSEKTTGWNLQRIGKAELTILRLAVYEILFDDSIPVSVAINEAVELARKYGAKDAPSFINGVLAKFAKA